FYFLQTTTRRRTTPPRCPAEHPPTASRATRRAVPPTSKDRPHMAKYVYFFGGKKAEGSAKDKNLLGGKGANLAEMVNIGIPVPAGFTVSTEVCTYYYKHDRTYPHKIHSEINGALRKVEKEMKAKFGDKSNPLLVSVRSGARV